MEKHKAMEEEKHQAPLFSRQQAGRAGEPGVCKDREIRLEKQVGSYCRQNEITEGNKKPMQVSQKINVAKQLGSSLLIR